MNLVAVTTTSEVWMRSSYSVEWWPNGQRIEESIYGMDGRKMPKKQWNITKPYPNFRLFSPFRYQNTFSAVFKSNISTFSKIFKSQNFPFNFTNDQFLIKSQTNTLNPKKMLAHMSHHCKVEKAFEWTDITFVKFVAKAKFISK